MTPHPIPHFQGRACVGVPTGPGRSTLVTCRTGQIIGTLRWHGQRRTWVLLSALGTAWDRGTLGDIGVGLRRRQRAGRVPEAEERRPHASPLQSLTGRRRRPVPIHPGESRGFPGRGEESLGDQGVSIQPARSYPAWLTYNLLSDLGGLA